MRWGGAVKKVNKHKEWTRGKCCVASGVGGRSLWGVASASPVLHRCRERREETMEEVEEDIEGDDC